MKFLDKLMGRDAPSIVAPEARSHAVALARPFVNTPALAGVGLRGGMWVMSAEGIGILTGCRDAVIKPAVWADEYTDDARIVIPAVSALRAFVTLVKPDGTTLMELDAGDKAVPAVRAVEVDTLRAAHIEEIPVSRHEGEDHLRGFGYISALEA